MRQSQTGFYWISAGAVLLSTVLAFGSTDLAKVNNRTISEAELGAALGGVNEGQRDALLMDPASRRQILNGLIDQELLVQEAEKEKLDQDGEFKDALNAFRKQFLASRLLQKKLSGQLTDQAAKKYYDAHKQRFSTDQVHAMHILVSTEEQAKDVLAKVNAPDADFQALAEKYSKDPSAKNNRGDLGFFGRDRMVSEFTDAAFTGKENEIVGPVRTAYGYHIIKVIARKPGKPMSFGDVELKVQNELRGNLTQDYVNKLRKKAQVQVLDKITEKQ